MRIRENSRAFIIDEKNEILLQQFIFKDVIDEKILWVTPGGGVEKRETPEIALKRELKEEMGINSIADSLKLYLELDVVIKGKKETFISREKYYKIFLDSSTDFTIEFMTENEKNTFKDMKWFSKEDIHELEIEDIVAPKDISKYIWNDK